MISIKRTTELLLEQDNILILTHDHPDGDTLGSGFALCRGLLALGKKAVVRCGDTIPEIYSFMWQGLPELDFEPEFIVSVDIADAVLLGREFEKKYKGKIDLNIDHHGSNNLSAKYVLLNSGAAAVAEIIYAILRKMNVNIDESIADCIYTGISTDTGCFRYANTTARTHLIAAALIKAGAKTSDINQTFFETKTRVYAALERLALDSLKMYFNDMCAVMTITQEMFRQSGATDSDCDRISAMPRQIEGVKVGATLRETKEGNFKVSLRTNGPVDAAMIAAKMGGGGHKRAAGCRLDGPLNRALEELLANASEEIIS